MQEPASSLARWIDELKRRRVFRVAGAYALAAWAVMQVGALVLPTLGLPEWTVRVVVVAALAGFPVALILGWVFDVTRAERRTSAADLTVSRHAVWSGAGFALFVIVVLATGAWMAVRPPAIPKLRYEQLTNFNDAALSPAISADGRMVAFIRGGARFGGSAIQGELYALLLPDGEPRALTTDAASKATPAFSPDGQRIAYTRLQEGFTWNTWEVPALGGTPRLLLANATGLSWSDARRVIFSELRTGFHMPLVTAAEDRTGQRDLFVPTSDGGMVHRSARSPDGQWLLAVEMDGTAWLPCRLLRLDGSMPSRQVGPPDSQCTYGAWSPDGAWMYFSAQARGAFHIWRQRLRDGLLQQLTSGAAEEEGLAMLPDGRSFITSVGTRQSVILLRDAGGERVLTSQAFAFSPTVAPDGRAVYYLVRTSETGNARSYTAGELWRVDLATGAEEPVLPHQAVTHFALSRDGRWLLFTTPSSRMPGGVWIADLERRQPPRQLTFGGEYRAFFGAPGEIIYQSAEPRRIHRMKLDGSERRQLREEGINLLLAVSPDGTWGIASRSSPTEATFVSALPLREDGDAVDVCSVCGTGSGPARVLEPPLAWSADGERIFVSLRHFGIPSTRTVVLPAEAGAPPPVLAPRLRTEREFAQLPGARLIDAANVVPGPDADSYLVVRQSAHANLYRVWIEE